MEPDIHETDEYMELETCPRCGGVGSYHWYLGDEFNSQGWSECDMCDGSGRESERNRLLDAYYSEELHDGVVDKTFSDWLRTTLLNATK